MKEIMSHVFAPEGKYKASGMFSLSHICLLFLTLYLISKMLNQTLQLPYSDIRNIIRIISILLWILEILKIIFKKKIEKSTSEYDTWVPLYYCSLALYASILSGYCLGNLQRMGDVFLGVGSLIGGISFLLYPSSSIKFYPWYHFLTLHSFFYHGCMTYMGILINRSGILKLQWSDFIFYALFFSFFCILANTLNNTYDTNLMFIAKPLEGTVTEYAYNILKDKYKIVVVIVHLFIPFLVIMLIITYTSWLIRPVWY